MTKILVVDDDDMTARLLELTFRQDGYEVHSVLDSLNAVSSARAFKPDLIVLDVMMPGKNGFEVCQELRALPSMKETRIVFLTGAGGMDHQLAAFEAGANAFMTKPIHAREFRRRIKTLAG
jgi:DNA-binding response OmpR family regulator